MAILTSQEITAYYQKYLEIVDHIKEINESQPENQKFKNIQIPVSLTQSIAYHFLLDNPLSIAIKNIVCEFLKEGNNRTFDLIYKEGEFTINIEVKATGTNSFQRLRKKALSADFVIWINFTSSTQYDIAVFKPIILNPNNRNEIEFDWNKLRDISEITFYKNREI